MWVTVPYDVHAALHSPTVHCQCLSFRGPYMRKDEGRPPPPYVQIQITLFNVTGYLEDSGAEVPFAFFKTFRIRNNAESGGYPCTKSYFEKACRMTLLQARLCF